MAACEMVDDNLVVLKKLTESLKFEDIVYENKPPETIELEMDSGTSYMVGLFKNEIVAVARNYASAGCQFPEHDHEQWELLIVYSGEMHLAIGGKKRILKPKNFYYMNPGDVHSAYFPKETWFLAITMPAADSWPEGG